MVVAYRYPRGTRNRPLLPHRQLMPLREMLIAQAEIYRSYAADYDDERWRDAAESLDRAAECLRDVSR